MSGHELQVDMPATAVGDGVILAKANAAMRVVNTAIVVLSSISLVAAGLVLTYSVASRFLFNAATYWQDEAAVLLLVGSTFLSTAYVQSRRGHIGIEALVSVLPKKTNMIRAIVVDCASFLFCAFFAWKSWTLFHEAVVDGQVSSSTWASPLWIPYLMMSVGMTLFSLQILLQICNGAAAQRSP